MFRVSTDKQTVENQKIQLRQTAELRMVLNHEIPPGPGPINRIPPRRSCPSSSLFHPKASRVPVLDQRPLSGNAVAANSTA